MQRKEVLYGFGLFIGAVAYFGLQSYAVRAPLYARAATPIQCETTGVPIGALSGQPASVWCYSNLPSIESTAVSAANSFIDTFDSILQFGDCCNAYSIFKLDTTGKVGYWRHNNGWLVDTDGMSSAMRPDRAFSFENEKLIVEASASATMYGYNEKVYPELIVTTASSATTGFAGHWNIRCSLQGATQGLHCTIRDTAGTIVYEKTQIGTQPSWRVCAAKDSYGTCMNTYRLEITSTTIALLVNGIPYAQLTGLPASVQTLTDKELYIYASTVNNNPPGTVYRMHWDRLAINPESMPKPTATPTPSRVATVSATIQPTKNLTPTQAPIENPFSIQFNGQGSATVPHTTYYNVPKGWTIEAWFKDESSKLGEKGYDHEARFILSKGDTETTENIPFILGIEKNNLFVGSRQEGVNKIITYDLTEHKVSFNEWHHVAATYDSKSNELVLFLDSVPVVKSTLYSYKTKDNKKPLYIGRNGNQHYWVGKLDEVRIWDKPRSAEEIRDTYLKSLTSQEKSLIGNWKFHEGKGELAKDFSSHKEHATIRKGIWATDVFVAR